MYTIRHSHKSLFRLSSCCGIGAVTDWLTDYWRFMLHSLVLRFLRQVHLPLSPNVSPSSLFLFRMQTMRKEGSHVVVFFSSLFRKQIMKKNFLETTAKGFPFRTQIKSTSELRHEESKNQQLKYVCHYLRGSLVFGPFGERRWLVFE